MFKVPKTQLHHLFLIFVCLVNIAGCSTPEIIPEPMQFPVRLVITPAADINPDYQNRPSPMVIRIYQLSQLDNFNNNDFYALYEQDRSLLSNQLLHSEEIELIPGQNQFKILQVHRNANFIAILAAYRDLDHAQWKTYIPVKPAQETIALGLSIEKSEVKINKLLFSIEKNK